MPREGYEEPIRCTMETLEQPDDTAVLMDGFVLGQLGSFFESHYYDGGAIFSGLSRPFFGKNK